MMHMATDSPAPVPVTPKPTFTHRWRLRRVLPQYFGKLCRIVPQDYSKRPGWKGGHAQGQGRVTVEFQDGTVIVTSRTGLGPIGGTYAKECSVEGCARPYRGAGYCNAHWLQFFRKRA